jgi:hypothetical protein
MESKKLITKIEFEFQDQIEPIEFNVDMLTNSKTKVKDNHINIINVRKKITDVSTKLF